MCGMSKNNKSFIVYEMFKIEFIFLKCNHV